MNNFRYALTMAQLLYDVNINSEDDAIEIGLIAYNFIGNKNTRLYKAQLPVVNGEAILPCNCDIIEAVTYCGIEDWNYTSNIKDFGDQQSLYVEHYIESHKRFSNPLYISGKYVKYRRSGDTLYINEDVDFVNVLYHGILVDSEGLPEINDKEATAIADYIAYVYKYKEGLRSNNSTIMQIAKDIKQMWLFHADAARVPEYVSQDEMNRILDAQSSWGRKVYGKSLKPVM